MPIEPKDPKRYEVQMGARGRLVLPAPARRQLGLEKGSRLLVSVDEPGVLKLTSSGAAAKSCLGILRSKTGDRSLVDELIAERRKAAENE